jgi:hypothetical protein
VRPSGHDDSCLTTRAGAQGAVTRLVDATVVLLVVFFALFL